MRENTCHREPCGISVRKDVSYCISVSQQVTDHFVIGTDFATMKVRQDPLGAYVQVIVAIIF